MIKGKDIIVIGIQAWDKIGSNCKNIALEFSINNYLLYVNQSMARSFIRIECDKEIKKRMRIG